MLTFEGQRFQDAQNIVSKPTSLPFHQCQHQISTVDFQPSGPAGGMLVFVSGNFKISGEQHALKFSQVLQSMLPIKDEEVVLWLMLFEPTKSNFLIWLMLGLIMNLINLICQGQKQGRNEFVIRLQPSEAMYMKLTVKQLGLEMAAIQSELDLS